MKLDVCFDYTLPTLMNVICKDHCLFCILKVSEETRINLYKCDLNLCHNHMGLIMGRAHKFGEVMLE